MYAVRGIKRRILTPSPPGSPPSSFFFTVRSLDTRLTSSVITVPEPCQDSLVLFGLLRSPLRLYIHRVVRSPGPPGRGSSRGEGRLLVCRRLHRFPRLLRSKEAGLEGRLLLRDCRRRRRRRRRRCRLLLYACRRRCRSRGSWPRRRRSRRPRSAVGGSVTQPRCWRPRCWQPRCWRQCTRVSDWLHLQSLGWQALHRDKVCRGSVCLRQRCIRAAFGLSRRCNLRDNGSF